MQLSITSRKDDDMPSSRFIGASLCAFVLALGVLVGTPAWAMASTPASASIAGASELPVSASIGPTEEGGGHKIDYWLVQLDGGDRMLINEEAACGTHFELYAPGTNDADFTATPPVSAASGCDDAQLTVQAPYTGEFVLAVCQSPNSGDCRSAFTGTVTNPMSHYTFTTALAGGGVSLRVAEGETAASPTIARADAADALTLGNFESGGGGKIDFWHVQLAGGDRILINNETVCGTHFDLYAPGTSDESFTTSPPVSSASSCNDSQIALQAPYNGVYILAVCQSPNDSDCRSADTGAVTDPMTPYTFSTALVNGGVPAATAAAETQASPTIASAKLLSLGQLEAGGGGKIDFWQVQLAAGDKVLLNNESACGTHFELYAPGTTDASFTAKAPLVGGSSCNDVQLEMRIPASGAYVLAVCGSPNDGDCRSVDTGTVNDPLTPYTFTLELAEGPGPSLGGGAGDRDQNGSSNPPLPLASLSHQTDEASAHGVVGIRIACGGSPCTGMLRLTLTTGGAHKRAVLLGTASFSHLAVGRHTIVVKLSHAALRLLHRHGGRLAAVAQVAYHVGTNTHVATAAVMLTAHR
jgi:hypothetical protein